MELFKLDSSYNPGPTVALSQQDGDTLVWSERYREAGDFMIVREDDITIMDLLPLGTLISHTDTYEVMMVETHEVEKDNKSKKIKTTIKGRTLETFAEQRPTLGTEYALYNSLNESIVETLTGTPASVAVTLLSGRLVPGVASSADAVPNLAVTSSMRVADTSMTRIIERGDIYTRVLELLNISDAGIKVERPHGAQTTMNIVIHDGLDKTSTVTFYAAAEDLDNGKYLWSLKNYRNYAQVDAHDYFRRYRHRDLGADATGLNRRILYVEASDIEGDFTPGTSSDAISARGQSALDEHKMVSLTQAKISESAKPKFKIDYAIGDLVTVFGEFAAAERMRVTEHILTMDKLGIRGYPSLSSA